MLESFSTLEYQKKLDKTTSQLFVKFKDENNTYVGAKVIKANGKETIVNTNEEVLTQNEDKNQKGKLAIPDLQVGDILDYYICKEYVVDKEFGDSYKDNDNVIFLVDEYPVIYYSIDFQFNKKLKVKTIYANAAPHFTENKNDDGDQLFSLKLHDIPKYESQLWTSSFRAYPYIEIGSAFNDYLDEVIEKHKFSDKNSLFQAQKTFFEDHFMENAFSYKYFESTMKKSFPNKGVFKKASADSIARLLYTQWKYNTFCVLSADDMTELSSRKYQRALSRENTINIALTLNNLKVDFDVILVASRYTNKLENAFNYDDFDALIRINSATPLYMCFDDINNQFDEIPERFQGEKVIILHPKRKNSDSYIFTESEAVLPVSPSNHNVINEQLQVSLDAVNMQELKIERLVQEKGSMRHDDQKKLLGMGNFDDAFTHNAHGIGLDKRLDKKTLKEVTSIFEKENDEKAKLFEEEIKSKFGQEPKGVSDCKIISLGLDDVSPVFEFKENFVLANLVKKAGGNYIVNVGKLTGGFLKLDEKDRMHDKDIYMPAARSFKYTIAIKVPAGYGVKGIKELIRKKENNTGSFSSEAVLTGNQLTITVNRVYNNNFEKSANWPQLVDVIDFASDFDNANVLFEKMR